VASALTFVGCLLRTSLLAISIIFSCKMQAQLCSGSLGDPVVNITFGTGAQNAGPSGYVPTVSYAYTTSTCPNDGYYTITSHSSDCFGNTWHIVTDHTGGGNFMLVNASYDPGDFFLTTVTDLCPNTTYEFATWIMNVMKPFSSIKPNIQFRIEKPDGTILAFYDPGDVAVSTDPKWVQYGFYFTTPPDNATIVLRIVNSAPGGYGNDLALDDITFRPCGSLITANIIGISTDTVNVCEDNTNVYNFTATASGYVLPVYRWQLSTDQGTNWTDIPGANSLTYQRMPTGPGNYWYRLTVTETSVAGLKACRISSTSVVVNVHAKPIVDAGPDRIVLTGNSAVLAGEAEGEDVIYSWSPTNYMNDPTDLTPTVSPPADIGYVLSARSAFGCSTEESVHVKVVTGIYVPTAFTPNGDGKNDRWEIPFLDPAFDATVSVFNRYGQLVYHSVSEVVSWDGKVKGVLQGSGAYVYLITFKGSNLTLKGTLILIR
jgi:gliding motility-associated-like protein